VSPRVALALRLGRVSNLPTVWTNVLAGAALGGGQVTLGIIVPLGIALSLLYVAGMYLNDAFDASWDAVHRRERPIPSGAVGAGAVFRAGFGMILAALVLLRLGPGGGRASSAGAVLAGLIVAYDALHKRVPALAAAAMMAACRALVYVTAARAVAPSLGAPVVVGVAVLVAYLMALSLIARQETRDARLPRLVGLMIAGISLLDAGLLVLAGHLALGALAGLAFLLTRRLQRRIAGT
jgi:4-hydroxybenzoate polyprenyltransferase